MEQSTQTHAAVHDNMQEDVCEHCAFSKFDLTGDAGECRMNPPTAFVVMMQNAVGQVTPSIQSGFPPIARRTYCYTFEPRDDIPA